MHSKTFFCNGWQLGKQTELGWFTVDEFAINHLNTNYRIVASSRPVYYSILDPLGKRSQNISIKFPLHKQSENMKMCY